VCIEVVEHVNDGGDLYGWDVNNPVHGGTITASKVASALHLDAFFNHEEE
jgi:hypothetical protein